jgi:hypothetical protein
MNPRDLSEIKRRLDPSKRNPAAIYGCYVSSEGEVLCSFVKPVSMLSDQEAEQYLPLFRKVLSGTQGQQLLSVGLQGAATVQDEAFERLNRMRVSRLHDEEAVQSFFGEVVMYLHGEQSRRAQSVQRAQDASAALILLLDDGFDVKTRRRDDTVDMEGSDLQFSYFLCCVCPVKPKKPGLAFDTGARDFCVSGNEWTVSAPDLGFLYPTLVQGGADIYTALFYTRSLQEPHEAFLERIFHAQAGMPAAEQQETLRNLLSETLEEECSMEVLQSMHEQVSGMIEERRQDKRADPLHLTGPEVGAVLRACGVSGEKAEAFEREYGETFGPYAEVPAVNLVRTAAFQVATPSVQVKVDPEHTELISTRVVDGKRYVMILADGAVEVNGVPVTFQEEGD